MYEERLDQIEEGMDVYALGGKHIGTVSTFRYGDGGLQVDLPETDTIVEIIAEALGGRPDLPEVVYTRLYQEGFIQINYGLMRSKVFIFPRQIEGIIDDNIYLNVTEDDLLQG